MIELKIAQELSKLRKIRVLLDELQILPLTNHTSLGEIKYYIDDIIKHVPEINKEWLEKLMKESTTSIEK